MKVVSVNVGLPKTVQWRDQSVSTGIFKSPVEGPVALRKHNLDGDQQADLSVHGGPTKAVYVYPVQHYTYWREELPGVDLGWGHFGENFSVDGMDEDSTWHRRRVQRRDGPGSGDRAAHAVLQAECSVQPDRHAEAVSPESAERFLLWSGGGGRGSGRRCPRAALEASRRASRIRRHSGCTRPRGGTSRS